MKTIKILAAVLVIFACASCAKQPYYSTKIISKLDTMAQKAERKFPESGIAQALQKVIVSDSKESAEIAADTVKELCDKLRTEKLVPHRTGLLIQNARAMLQINHNGNPAIIDAWQKQTSESVSPILDSDEARTYICAVHLHHFTTQDLHKVNKQIEYACSITYYLDILYWDA